MISEGYKSAYQQGYSDAMRDFRKKPSRDMEEIKEIIYCDADAKTKCKMISNILTAKPHYFEESQESEGDWMANDLISRKDIDLTDHEILMCDGDYKVAFQMLLEKIDKAPSVQPQPKMGKWIKTSLSQVSGGDFNRGFKCSCCDYVIVVDDFNYCPNCGAKMQ